MNKGTVSSKGSRYWRSACSSWATFLSGGRVGLPLEYTLEQLRQGIERGVLVIRDAAAFPAHMRLVGYVLFQHLHEAALAYARITRE